MVYPLVDAKITREDCVQIIKRAKFPMPIKSGCFICPYAGNDRWEYIRKHHPDEYQLALKLEEHNKHFPKQVLRKGGLRKGKNRQQGEDDCQVYCHT
jgi:hypothetical protein